MQELERLVNDTGVALVGSLEGPVAFGFTERTGGVSKPPFASLNLGSHVGDAPEAVQENRRRVLAALGCEEALGRLIVPNQVHGDHVVTVSSSDAAALGEARAEATAGADAVVCTVPGVPVLLCFADCVPVIVVCPGGFAVVHSGWRARMRKSPERRRVHWVRPRAARRAICVHILARTSWVMNTRSPLSSSSSSPSGSPISTVGPADARPFARHHASTRSCRFGGRLGS